MLLNGLKNLIVSLLLLLTFTKVMAEDFGIALPDQLDPDSLKLDDVKDRYNFGEHVMGNRDDTDDKWKASENGDFALSKKDVLKNKKISDKEEIKSFGSGAPFEMDNREHILESKNSEIFKSVYSKGASSFSFTYIQDKFDVDDSANVFERSYNAEQGTRRGGSLHLFFDNYFSKSFISPFWGGGFGVGYSQGKGIFSNSAEQESNVKFQLFTVPLDFRVGLDIGRGEFFKLSVAVGPSVVGLHQSRSDKERDEKGEDGKYRRQIGYGYFGHAKAQISLSKFATKMAFDTYSQYDISNIFINLEGRYQKYENFQDDISISGVSFGVGLSFEYL